MGKKKDKKKEEKKLKKAKKKKELIKKEKAKKSKKKEKKAKKKDKKLKKADKKSKALNEKADPKIESIQLEKEQIILSLVEQESEIEKDPVQGKSKDYNVREAVAKIRMIKTLLELSKFVRGDQRITIKKAVVVKKRQLQTL